jgi:hypothetical protein
LVQRALEVFFELREVPGLKKKPSTSELIDWLKLLLAEDIPAEALRNPTQKAIPPLHGALLKNEQDVQLLRASGLHASSSAALISHVDSLFEALRAEKVPVTLREWLDLMARLAGGSGLCRHRAVSPAWRGPCMVKDERHFDRFDRAFGSFWQGVSSTARRGIRCHSRGLANWREFERVSPTRKKRRSAATWRPGRS